MLDRPVTDATTGVELIGRDERVGRASVKTSCAGAAVARRARGSSGSSSMSTTSAAEQSEAPQPAVDQHRVLTHPSDPGEPARNRGSSSGAVSQRARPFVPGSLGAEPVEQGIEPAPEQLVIIPTSGVTRHLPLRRPGRGRVGAPGYHGGPHYRLRAVEEPIRGAREPRRVARQVIHSGGVAGVEPGEERGIGRRRDRRARHADPVEAEPDAPRP